MFRHRGVIIRELSEQRSIRPALLCRYCVAFIKLIKILKFKMHNFNILHFDDALHLAINTVDKHGVQIPLCVCVCV
jgi:hypothetical protein